MTLSRWLAAALAVLVAGCGGMNIDDYRGTTPVFQPESYFAGQTRAWGFFQDRFGTIRREFTVDITGTVDGDTLVLDEDFTYADGERAKRVWTIRRVGEGVYEGTAADVVGTARGRAVGRAMNWVYEFELPRGDSTLRVTMDDWMFLQDDEVMLNRTTVRKFGIKLGEVVIFFRKLPGEAALPVGREAFAKLLQHAAE
jgi:hypothetical protein